MRLLVTGGRMYADRAFLFAVLDRVHARRPVTLLIEGGATGADRLARKWAVARGVALCTVEADWASYGKRAGRVRNCAMLREQRPELVVAFAGGRGTAHMVGEAERGGVPVLRTWRYLAAYQANRVDGHG